MKIPQPVVMTVSSGITTAVALFWEKSVVIMIPWLLSILAAVIADLASGRYKAKRLGIHFAWSTAFRETLGKITVYYGFVMAAAMFDVAAEGNATIAKWLCIFVSAIEIGSVLSNILAPHGIKLSLKAILKLILKKSPLGIDDEAADEIVKTARRENQKWNKAKYASESSLANRPFNRIYDEDTGKVTYERPNT